MDNNLIFRMYNALKGIEATARNYVNDKEEMFIYSNIKWQNVLDAIKDFENINLARVSNNDR